MVKWSSLLFGVLVWTACAGDDPASPPNDDDGPSLPTNFDFLPGTWNVTSRYLEDGVFVESQGVSIIESSLGARVLKERWVGTRAGGPVEMLALYGRSDFPGRWLVVRGDGERGTFDVLEGTFGSSITLSSRSDTRPDSGRERVTFDSVTSNRFLWRAERSEDAGASWTTYWTMVYQRAPAGTVQPVPPNPAPGCTAAAYHQFDFWVGDWDINGARNIIPSRLGGCIVEENWTGSESGTSFNMYDPRSQRWTQVWIDTNGNTLFMQGGLQGNEMVLQGPRVNPGIRITWTPLSGGRVRQFGQNSPDGGATWSTLYDLMYVPR
jgi:hypothetical protein